MLKYTLRDNVEAERGVWREPLNVSKNDLNIEFWASQVSLS